MLGYESFVWLRFLTISPSTSSGQAALTVEKIRLKNKAPYEAREIYAKHRLKSTLGSYTGYMAEEIKPLRHAVPMRSIPGDTHTAEHRGLRIDVYRLIHLTQKIPESEIEIEDLQHQMGDFCWTDEHGPITPEFVVHICQEIGYEKASTKYPSLAQHIDKIKNSDLSFPIILYKENIIDGMHRLAKAAIENHTRVKARVLDEIPEDALLPQEKKS